MHGGSREAGARKMVAATPWEMRATRANRLLHEGEFNHCQQQEIHYISLFFSFLFYLSFCFLILPSVQPPIHYHSLRPLPVPGSQLRYHAFRILSIHTYTSNVALHLVLCASSPCVQKQCRNSCVPTYRPYMY